MNQLKSILRKMFETELIVRLIIPDNTAVTAFYTLEKMGHKLKGLKRENYYKFYVDGNEKEFIKKIGKVDILVNYNKNSYTIKKPNEKFEDNNFINIRILVKNIDDNAFSLLSTLKERLGFKNIKKIEKGVLWTLSFDSAENAKNQTEEIAKNLLVNENYQEYSII